MKNTTGLNSEHNQSWTLVLVLEPGWYKGFRKDPLWPTMHDQAGMNMFFGSAQYQGLRTNVSCLEVSHTTPNPGSI